LLEYSYSPNLAELNIPNRNLSFMGYRRKSGEVGIRNEIWVIPTVGCVNGIVNRLADSLRRETGSVNVDAIVAFPHNYGCSQLGNDHENTRKILRDMVLHPNAGAVLVVGLGCENNQLSAFKGLLGEYDAERIRFMECQKVDDEYEEGMDILRQLYDIASQDARGSSFKRTESRVEVRRIDGFSGITANPLWGYFRFSGCSGRYICSYRSA
ncbi:MAG: UxaA family hydrolase, partial [Coprobacter sp.]